MTQDDIIEFGKQAGLEAFNYPELITEDAWEKIEAFAKLVAAKEQEAIIDLVAFYGGPVDLEAAIRARGND